jgi:hypothetical protein
MSTILWSIYCLQYLNVINHVFTGINLPFNMFYEYMLLLFLWFCIMVYHHTDMFYILRVV